jgi:hypothetical protein
MERDFGLFVGVELGQREAACVFGLQLLQDGAQRLAWAAPGSPDVEQHRLLQRGVDEVGFEVLERDVDHGKAKLRLSTEGGGGGRECQRRLKSGVFARSSEL